MMFVGTTGRWTTMPEPLRIGELRDVCVLAHRADADARRVLQQLLGPGAGPPARRPSLVWTLGAGLAVLVVVALYVLVAMQLA